MNLLSSQSSKQCLIILHVELTVLFMLLDFTYERYDVQNTSMK